LFLTKTFKFLKNAKTSVVGSTVGRKTQFRGAHHLSLIRTPSSHNQHVYRYATEFYYKSTTSTSS